MTIFNSLGSNYRYAEAIRVLFSFGGKAEQTALTTYLEERYGGDATLVYKGRDALKLALDALPEKGRVAFNGYTCLAVYESITASGHTPHYLDIAEGKLDFSFHALQEAILANPDIKAVIVQNTLGIPSDLTPIAALCRTHGLALIEDLAHSIGATYPDGKEAGTIGDFVILSFSQDKVVDAVSGGALIVRNKKYAHQIAPVSATVSLGQQLKDRLYPMLTWKIRLAYMLGIGKPYHAFLRALGILSTPFGREYPPRTLPGWYCANILRQFKALEQVAAHRRAIANEYALALDKSVRLAFTTDGASNLRFPILVQGRDRLIDHLKENGVHISDIWYDAPIAPKKYMHRAKYAGECPQAEKISATMLNLPTHTNVSTDDARRIATLVNEWFATDSDATYALAPTIDQSTWDTFMTKIRPHSFLHSWQWGEHNEATGSKVFRIAVRKGDDIVAAALFIQINARRSSFLLCPHGPILSETEDQAHLLRIIAREATRIGNAQECDFVRFCPLAKDAPENRAVYRSLGFRDAPIHMHPELSWMLDVTKSEDDLMREMRKTTRYLVKKMEKEGVEITQSVDPNDIEKFWAVYQATVERQHFTPFKKLELRKEFELFAAHNQAAFFFGSYRGELIAAAIIIFYNGQAFYHHSGSLHKFKDINASYLLQWRVIQEAKKRGCTLYNFWGISPADKPDHPWAGLSLFKKGFGGFAEEYLHAQDKPLTAKYQLNYIIETTRRIRRGL